MVTIKKFLGFLAGVALLLIFASAVNARGKTSVYRFADEPFSFTQCYSLSDPWPDPAVQFGEDVCVDYEALNSETVRVSESGDVSWTLVQHGTARVFAQGSGDLLYEGNFQVEEVARDLDGDAECLTEDNHAWAGNCERFFSNLDFLEYHWKIDGGVYFFRGYIRGAGNWCYTSREGDSFGPACMP